jgi:hypothetical protein
VLSNIVADFPVAENRLERGIAGVGSIDSSDNLDEGSVAAADSVPNVVIEQDRIYGSGTLMDQERGGDKSSASRCAGPSGGNIFNDAKLTVTVASN